MAREQTSSDIGRIPPEALRSLPDLLRFASRDDVLDLALGIPPGPPPDAALGGVMTALRGGRNQYIDSRGLVDLRRRLADGYSAAWGHPVDADGELTITCGVAGGVFCTLMSLLEPGDEVIALDPGFSHHARTVRLLGGRVVHVPLDPPNWTLDLDRLAAAFGPRTRCVLLANPGNPTGRLLEADELDAIAALCTRWSSTLLVDEIYADFTYEGRMTPAWALRAAGHDVVVFRGVSKSHSASGWRIGFTVAPDQTTTRLRAVHDASTLGASTPLQFGVLHALADRAHPSGLRDRYRQGRDRIAEAFGAVPGARATRCDGGIFLCVAVDDDLALTDRLLSQAGLLVGPGRMFFADPARGRRFVRVCFARRPETISDAVHRLRALVDTAADR